jgi:hypothetical protein
MELSCPDASFLVGDAAGKVALAVILRKAFAFSRM